MSSTIRRERAVTGTLSLKLKTSVEDGEHQNTVQEQASTISAELAHTYRAMHDRLQTQIQGFRLVNLALEREQTKRKELLQDLAACRDAIRQVRLSQRSG
jgi:hypothetical protein